MLSGRRAGGNTVAAAPAQPAPTGASRTLPLRITQDASVIKVHACCMYAWIDECNRLMDGIGHRTLPNNAMGKAQGRPLSGSPRRQAPASLTIRISYAIVRVQLGYKYE